MSTVVSPGAPEPTNVQDQERSEPTSSPVRTPSNPLDPLKATNYTAKISSFAMGDGPISLSLNIYDGRTLQQIIKDLLNVVSSQATEIASFHDHITDLKQEITNSSRRNTSMIKALDLNVSNLAQNIQGFVDNEPSTVQDISQDSASIEKTEFFVKAAPKIPSEPPSRSVTPVPDAAESPKESPKESPQESPPSPQVAPQAAPLIPSPPRSTNPFIRQRFQRAVKRIIIQNRMKSFFVGVLTSRAAKGLSIGERLRSAEDLIFAATRRCELLEGVVERQKGELEEYKTETVRKHGQLSAVDDELNEGIIKVDEKLTKFEPLIAAVETMVANAAKESDEMKAMVATVEKKGEATQGYIDTFVERSSGIVTMNAELWKEMMEECVSRAKKLADEITQANADESLTSDQIFHLRRQLCLLDSQNNEGLNVGSQLGSYVECDPTNFKGVQVHRTAILDAAATLTSTIEPLWGTVASFDSNIAQSINLVMTLRTGLSSQKESLESMERDLLTKAGIESVDLQTSKLRAQSQSIEENVKGFSTQVNTLNEGAAELNNKVVDIYDKMENIVDEEKLKDNVKKLLELYVKQLEAKQAGDSELVVKIQAELETQSSEVDKLFKTKADVGQVDEKAEQKAVDAAFENMSKLQEFMKQFEEDIGKMKNGQADGMERLRKMMEQKLTKALMNNQGMGGGGEDALLSHKKVDLCLACNRPMGKSVSMNASVPYFGPKFDPTNQLLGKPSMLLQLEKDEHKRRQTTRNSMLLPRGLPKGLYSGGFQMPVKQGVWSEDLGGMQGSGGGGGEEEDDARERKVRKTLIGMHIDPDSPNARDSFLAKARRESNVGVGGQRVGKSWMSVSSKGLKVDEGGKPEAGGAEGTGKRESAVVKQRSRTMQGKSLKMLSPKNSCSANSLSPKGGNPGDDFSLPAVCISKIA